MPGEVWQPEEIEKAVSGIKAVLVDERHIPAVSVEYEWKNQLVNGV